MIQGRAPLVTERGRRRWTNTFILEFTPRCLLERRTTGRLKEVEIGFDMSREQEQDDSSPEVSRLDRIAITDIHGRRPVHVCLSVARSLLTSRDFLRGNVCF